MWALGDCHLQVLHIRCTYAGVVVVPLVAEPALYALAQQLQHEVDLQVAPPPPVSRGAEQLPVQQVFPLRGVREPP